MDIENLSPFVADTVLMLDPRGAETMAVVVKATYDVSGRIPRLAPQQEPLQVADTYTGEPGQSSIRFASDRIIEKRATDVVLVGNAYPAHAGGRRVDVELNVGPVRKLARVCGDRVWSGGPVTAASEPGRFDRIPLTYERSFGGVDPDGGERCAANPVGVGFRGRRTRMPISGTALPNIEDPRYPMVSPTDRPPVAGFGVISPSWEPRLALAGTYDEAWLSSRAPLPPADYDPRFQQVAPADQVCPGFLEGGEPVEVRNASPRGPLVFPLPRPRIQVEVEGLDDVGALPVRLDTVVIDGERQLLLLTWRGRLPVHGRVYDVEFVSVSAEGAE